MVVWWYKSALFAAFLLPAAYLWRKVFTTYKSLKQALEKEKLFLARHNCVVMFSRTHIRGWPPETITIDGNNIHRFLEPYLFFIDTAERTLDVAVMVVQINQILDAMVNATKRGVRVRMIVNFHSISHAAAKYTKLLKAGVKIQYFVSQSGNMGNIMHYKYMVKDCDCKGGCEGSTGYICMGSMNYTNISTILNNYEDVTFSSNCDLSAQFCKNFQDSWNLIERDNLHLYNKTVLADAGVLNINSKDKHN